MSPPLILFSQDVVISRVKNFSSGDYSTSSGYLDATETTDGLSWKISRSSIGITIGSLVSALSTTNIITNQFLPSPYSLRFQAEAYKACTYVIKSAQAGPITCGKPILRSTIPSFCTVHFQKAQKHVNRALKKDMCDKFKPKEELPSQVKLLSRKKVLTEPYSSNCAGESHQKIKGENRAQVKVHYFAIFNIGILVLA